ncbi:MAG TPA: ferrous iron transport protein B [Bacilli bacterium]|nr:ferrous iron transport protein B [Bacilli bacterium]
MRIALAGNPNSGKTTLFNLLCGTNQKIGNWPGVTIEKKAGIWRGTDIEILDLPGIYSLAPHSADEEVSRKALFTEQLDLIINIVDATSLERSLYLTTQLLELDTDILVVLNMEDNLVKKGLQVNHAMLGKLLGVSVLPLSALKETGLRQLETIVKTQSYLKKETNKKIFPAPIEDELATVMAQIESKHQRFVAVKLIENDRLFQYIHPSGLSETIEKLADKYQVDAIEMFANCRYRYIEGLRANVVTAVPIHHTLSEKLDRVFLHKIFALPIFGVVMFLTYFLSVGLVGSFTADFIDSSFANLTALITTQLTNWGASVWATSLVGDGVLAGVTTLLIFVPQLIMLFLLIGLLETTGYIARISFFLDKVFVRLGLSGRSLIPFIVGSGCSVPAILSSRAIENEQERKMTIMLTPFVPCSAKLPIIALFAGFFFPNHSGIVSFLMYALSVLVIVLSALFLKRFFFKGRPGSYISELPDYHLPNPKYLAIDVFEKTWEFVRRAGSIIILSSIAIWLLASFDWRFNYGIDPSDSMLAGIGNLFAWLFYPMLGGNMSWGAAVAAFQGLIAKENVVASMAVIAGLSSDTGSGQLIFAPDGLFAFFTPVTSIAFIAFNLFSAPCIASIAAMRREFGTKRMMGYAILYQTLFAWLIASLIGGVGTLIMMGINS